MRTVLLSACVGLLTVASSAHASQSGLWIVNGSSLEYAGSNKLRIGQGTVWGYDGGSGVPGQNFQVTTTTVTTAATPSGMLWASSSTTGCPTSTTSLQGDSAAYYVYYEGATSTVVATTVAPFENGYPTGSLYMNPGSGCVAHTSSAYNYLGSFITNSSGNIVPFERHGDRVLLNFNGGANPSATAGFDAGSFASLSISSFVYPTTAAALILEAQTTNNDTSYTHTVSILDANNSPATACDAGLTTTDWSTSTQVGGTQSPVTQEQLLYPTSTSLSTTLTAADCDGSWGSPGAPGAMYLGVFYYGYIEPVPYLDQIR